ncbi:MAG: GNAT family N-acetyltransferase, partial [Promethearchaeota archaeon]
NEEFGNIPIQWAQPEYYVRSTSDSEIIRRVNILERKISFNKHSLNVGGITGVITRSECTRNGIGSCMLKNTAVFISSDFNIDFGLLLCRDEVASFYEKLGWKVVDGPTSFYQPQGKMIFPRLMMVFERGQIPWQTGAIDLCALPW